MLSSETNAIFAAIERVLGSRQSGLRNLNKIMNEVREQTTAMVSDDELLEMIIEVRVAQATASMFSPDDTN